MRADDHSEERGAAVGDEDVDRRRVGNGGAGDRTRLRQGPGAHRRPHAKDRQVLQRVQRRRRVDGVAGNEPLPAARRPSAPETRPALGRRSRARLFIFHGFDSYFLTCLCGWLPFFRLFLLLLY